MGMSVTHLVPLPADSGDYNAAVSLRIRLVYTAAGLRSQAQLARRVGWEPMYVSRRMKDDHEAVWSVLDLKRIADALGVPVAALIPDEPRAAVTRQYGASLLTPGGGREPLRLKAA